MSNSVQPHRWQPARLPCPWDSPGKNTGMGCHFLLQCMKVKSESEVAQLCLTPSNPMDCSLPGSSIHGIFQAKVLEWDVIAFSKWGTNGGISAPRAFCSRDLVTFLVVHFKLYETPCESVFACIASELFCLVVLSPF